MIRRLLILASTLALVACTAETITATAAPAKPATGLTLVALDDGNVVYKTCDAGRAIYVFDGYKSGGIAVVDNAPECGGGQ